MGLKLKIIDLNGIYLEDEVDLLCIKTTAGELTILANHIPLITNILISRFYTIKNRKRIDYAIAGGTLFVSDKDCNIITTAVESQAEIDFKRAELAKARAEERINKADKDTDIRRAEVALQRAVNRLSLKD